MFKGQATKHGIIIKSGEALEIMGKVDTIAFDKTGTLTYGRLEVSDIVLLCLLPHFFTTANSTEKKLDFFDFYVIYFILQTK